MSSSDIQRIGRVVRALRRRRPGGRWTWHGQRASAGTDFAGGAWPRPHCICARARADPRSRGCVPHGGCALARWRPRSAARRAACRVLRSGRGDPPRCRLGDPGGGVLLPLRRAWLDRPGRVARVSAACPPERQHATPAGRAPLGGVDGSNALAGRGSPALASRSPAAWWSPDRWRAVVCVRYESE